MRVLGPVVQIAALSVFYTRKQLTFRHAVAPQFVGDQDARHILQAVQQPLEEALRCSGIAAALDQNIEYDAVLVDRPPEIMQYTPDPDEHLIQMPLVTRSRSAPAQFVGEARAELQAPLPNALIGDDYTTLRRRLHHARPEEVRHPGSSG
jgi:hypothetical protein